MDKEMLDNLTAAVSNGRTDILRTLVNIYSTRINEGHSELSCDKILSLPCNSVGTLLHLATKLDHVDIVRTLLCSGADPNVQNSLGETPYDLVQSQSMTAVYVDELLKCSAKSEIDRIHQLINAGVDINAPDAPDSGNRALHWAVCFGKPEAVQCLLDLGALPNVLNGQGATPLHEAVKRKNMDILRILLSAGADPTIKSSSGKYFGKTPLELAENNKQILDFLLEYVPNDSESDKSIPNNNIALKTTSQIIENELSESLQSLSTSLELSIKPNLASYVPQPVNVPSFLFSPLPLITDSKLHLLWPQPQKIVQTDGPPFKLEQKYFVHIVRSTIESINSIVNVWNTYIKNFELYGVEYVIEDVVDPESVYVGNILCHINENLFPKKESYKLIISAEQIRILSSDVLGLHYALCTLGQLIFLYTEDNELPSLFIHDWPQLQHRAVLLDLTMGVRKPLMETLKGYIRTMSFLKLRQLHCYFRYDLLAEENFPYSNKEFLELSTFSKEHHVCLIPAIDVDNHVTYADIKNSLTVPVNHLMTLFSSKELEVGPNLSKLLLEELLATKNSQFVWNVLRLPSSSLLYICCSSIHQNPELLRLIPFNCILMDYAYQVEYDYEFNAKFYTTSGYNVCIGTGTKTWGSIAGIPENTVSFVHKASLAASLNGSFGLIVADWKTLPHHPAFCFSWPGIILTLGLAWNCTVHEDYLRARLAELLNLYVYRDMASMTGYLNVELGRLETYIHQSIFQNQKDTSLQVTYCQSSVLHQLLRDPDAVILDNFTFDVLQQAIRHLKKFELDLQKAKPMCFQHGEIISELRLAMDLLLFACRLSRVMVSTGLNPTTNSCGLAVINVGTSNLPPIARTDLANRLLALTEQYRAVWLSRNLPCGLQTSLCMFNSLLHKLIPENEHSLYSINGSIDTSNNLNQTL